MGHHIEQIGPFGLPNEKFGNHWSNQTAIISRLILFLPKDMNVATLLIDKFSHHKASWRVRVEAACSRVSKTSTDAELPDGNFQHQFLEILVLFDAIEDFSY